VLLLLDCELDPMIMSLARYLFVQAGAFGTGALDDRVNLAAESLFGGRSGRTQFRQYLLESRTRFDLLREPGLEAAQLLFQAVSTTHDRRELGGQRIFDAAARLSFLFEALLIRRHPFGGYVLLARELLVRRQKRGRELRFAPGESLNLGRGCSVALACRAKRRLGITQLLFEAVAGCRDR